MSAKTDLLVVGGVALALLAAAWYAKKKLNDAVDGAEQKLGDVWGGVKSGANSAVDAVFGAASDAVEGINAAGVRVGEALGGQRYEDGYKTLADGSVVNRDGYTVSPPRTDASMYD